jgi:YYY domain-containing protein
VYIVITHYKKLTNWILENRGYILKIELLWLVLFVLDLFIRRANPDLWHPVYGGEKPMDFSYFNAVIKSTYFPPYDPWFSGGYINYYYFGYVIAAIPTKLLGILPAITYNLLVPTLFAMTGVGAFCVSYNLAVKIGYREKSGIRLSPSLAGYAGAVLMVIMGNLGQPETVYKGMSRVIDNNSSELLVDGYQVPGFISGIYEVFANNKTVPIGTGEWYWNATRIIPHPVNESGPITEFPLFTFLYGDLHAHMLALPVTLAALVWSIAVVFGKGKVRSKVASVTHWALGGIVIGSLAATNTWDYPTYMLIGCCAIVWVYIDGRCRANNRMRFADSIGKLCLLVILASLFFLPYATWYGSSYTKLQIWRGSTTPILAYLQVHGLFLFLVVGYLIGETRIGMLSGSGNFFGNRNKFADTSILSILLLVIIAGLGLYVSGVVVAPLILGLVVWSISLMMMRGQSAGKRMCLGLTSVALLLTLFVECVRLDGDIGRMNTVFKFYLQVWTLFSVVGGVALAWTIGQTKKWKYGRRIFWYVPFLTLVLISISYTVLAISAKTRDRMAIASPGGLDGMDFMQYASYEDKGKSFALKADYDAISWMQDNVTGSPVIVEAHTPEYRWGSRYTVYTGLPGVVGWNWHQRQQRASTPTNLVTNRVEAINAFYTNDDIGEALTFLDRYSVKYVVVGEYELAYYPFEGLDKLRRMVDMDLLQVAYKNDGVVIYEHSTDSGTKVN